MAEPLFLLQIVDGKGGVVKVPGGGALERDLIAVCTEAILKRGAGQIAATSAIALRDGLETAIDRCVEAIVARGVGFLRTEAQVTQAIRDGLREVLLTQVSVSRRITHDVEAAWGADEVRAVVAGGIKAAMQTLKDQTVQVV